MCIGWASMRMPHRISDGVQHFHVQHVFHTTSQRHCISDWLDLVKCDVEREQISDRKQQTERASDERRRTTAQKKKTVSHSVNIGWMWYCYVRLTTMLNKLLVIWSENTSVGGKRQAVLVARASLIKHTGMTHGVLLLGYKLKRKHGETLCLYLILITSFICKITFLNNLKDGLVLI